MSDLLSQHKDEIIKHLKANQKIHAIKYAVDTFKIPLKDAVRLVNTVDQELNPDKKIDIDAFMPGSGLPKIFYYTFGGVGALLVCIAAIMFYFDQVAINSYTKTSGTVVDLSYSGGSAAPVVAYNWEGTEMLYTGGTYSNPPSYDIDEQVELYVNPEDSSDVLIDTFSERFFGMTVVGGLGLLFTGFLYLFHKVFNRKISL